MAALLVAGAACDSPAPVAPSSRPPAVRAVDAGAPCDVLSPAQVEEAVGTPVEREREADSLDGTRLCSYDTTAPYSSVSVAVEPDMTAREFDKRMERDPANTEILDGPADAAFVHACASVELLEEDVFVSISVQHLTTCEETQAVLRALATEAVASLTGA